MPSAFIDHLKVEAAKEYIKSGEYRWINPANKLLTFHPEIPEPDRNWQYIGQFEQIEINYNGEWNKTSFRKGFLPFQSFYGKVTIQNLYTMKVNKNLLVNVKFEIPHAFLTVRLLNELIYGQFATDSSPETNMWRQYLELLPIYSSLMRPHCIPISLTGQPIPIGLLQITPTAPGTLIKLATHDPNAVRLEILDNIDTFKFDKSGDQNTIYELTLQMNSFLCQPANWSAGFPDRFVAQNATIHSEEVGSDITLEDIIFTSKDEKIVFNTKNSNSDNVKKE